jgi:D-beta-D-heptose 7-phosphate kinase/D-beta-D-heptose 1-phosphate adenosyltransferase
LPKIVFVNGTFDIIHLGHLALFNYAKSLGDFLLVAIDSDNRVKQLKGNSRPVNNEHERKTLLENLKAIDKVQIFDTDQELIDIIATCDIMVKGSDYINKPIVGEHVCKQIIFFDRINGYSTTKKIQSITNR